MVKNDIVRIKFKNRDLINRFGVVEMDMQCSRAQEYIKSGMAIFADSNNRSNESQLKELHSHSQSITPKPIHLTNLKLSSPNNINIKHQYHDIIWLQDAERIGGAELSSKLVCEIGRKCGFDIFVMIPQTFNWNILINSKHIIINNMWHFDTNKLQSIHRAIFEFLIPYSIYSHDIRDTDHHLEYARRLYKHARNVWFISPEHAKKVINKLSYKIPNVHILPLAIDTSLFKPVKNIKRIKNLAISTAGRLHNAKQPTNLYAFIKSHPQYNYELYLEITDLIHNMFGNMKNVTLQECVNIEELPEIYSKAEFLIHLPSIFGAGERVIFEAALCGCKVISNKNAGHMSWNYNFEDIESVRNNLTRAPYLFWQSMENVEKLS